MSLSEKIVNDLKEAMKERDSFKLNVIRLLKGAIMLEKINKQHELSDEEVIDVVGKQIKMRKDSILEFSKAGREDLVKQNQDEINILNQYMPKALTEEEVLMVIEEAFQKIQPTSSKCMGLIMKEVTPKLKGKCDMSFVSSYIKNKLN